MVIIASITIWGLQELSDIKQQRLNWRYRKIFLYCTVVMQPHCLCSSVNPVSLRMSEMLVNCFCWSCTAFIKSFDKVHLWLTFWVENSNSWVENGFPSPFYSPNWQEFGAFLFFPQQKLKKNFHLIFCLSFCWHFPF